jgi:hypothetical protein
MRTYYYSVTRDDSSIWGSWMNYLAPDVKERKWSERKRKYYFAYAQDGQDYLGGWTEIEAPDEETAELTFMRLHPCREAGILNCAAVYREDIFVHTGMFRYGNFGARCWEKVQAWWMDGPTPAGRWSAREIFLPETELLGMHYDAKRGLFTVDKD